jgi:cell fate (sporulation/competence/biofilm development) regulator YmcA (YheA/YmcA/DUF963 family)
MFKIAILNLIYFILLRYNNVKLVARRKRVAKALKKYKKAQKKAVSLKNLQKKLLIRKFIDN